VRGEGVSPWKSVPSPLLEGKPDEDGRREWVGGWMGGKKAKVTERKGMEIIVRVKQ